MRISNNKIVKDTINMISDCVTQTMGAKGRLAVINDEFSRPLLTDDGVTVARQFMHIDNPFEKMVALSICEAAGNTERYAYDGTTLTVMMVKELYNHGCKLIRKGMHPQVAADHINKAIENIRRRLQCSTFQLNEKRAYDLACVTTKMPEIGRLVQEAYKKSGPAMNVLIEHDRKIDKSTVEFTDGMVLDYGFFTNEMQQLCNDETKTKTVFHNAHLLLLSEGQMSQRDVINFFKSIPEDNIRDEYVIFITKAFNPESLKMLLDQLVSNKFKFQFVFINESNPEELFVDLAARTNGHIQSAAEGTSDYRFEHCGLAEEITIEQDKTTIIAKEDNNRVEQRIAAYEKEINDSRYSMSITRHDTITRRLANLKGGVTKIKLACQTSTEYMTIKLKLDDAIGAVKCAAKEGLLLGGGKALFNLRGYDKEFKHILSAPLLTICSNAGIKLSRKTIARLDCNAQYGIDVVNNKYVNLPDAGLFDSFSSIDKALSNATSIATSYLRAYILINTAAASQG